MFHIQIQEPTRNSTTTRAFVFPAKFIITKYLKQEFDDDLSVCVDERSLCGLSIIGDIKIFQCHVIKRSWRYYPQWRKALSTSIMELLLLLKFENSSSSVTWDKVICQVIMSWWHQYHLRRSTLELFQWCLSGVQIWCF